MKALIVADDLTGASDTVVQFTRAGWSTLLSLSGGWREEPAEDAVALTLDTRRDPHAASLTARVVGDLATGALYVKIDSTVRGRVPEQVRGALAGYRRHHPTAFAVVCPAYPAMGRTVADGVVLVAGKPVHESPAGRDPVTPVTESDLRLLLPGSVLVSAESDLTEALREAGADHDVVLVDARDDEDLGRLADAVAAIGRDAMPVGSAGLAGALSAAWRPERPSAPAAAPSPPQARTLVVVSSLHEVARAQARELQDHADPHGWDVDLLISPEEHAGGAAGQPARDLARRSGETLREGRHDFLVLVGGDGAAATLNAIGATGIRVDDAPVEGVPVGSVVGGPHEGLRVATKAGGFGDPTTLITLFTTVHTQGAPS